MAPSLRNVLAIVVAVASSPGEPTSGAEVIAGGYAEATAALVIEDCPADAAVSINGQPTSQRGPLREYQLVLRSWPAIIDVEVVGPAACPVVCRRRLRISVGECCVIRVPLPRESSRPVDGPSVSLKIEIDGPKPAGKQADRDACVSRELQNLIQRYAEEAATTKALQESASAHARLEHQQQQDASAEFENLHKEAVLKRDRVQEFDGELRAMAHDRSGIVEELKKAEKELVEPKTEHNEITGALKQISAQLQASGLSAEDKTALEKSRALLRGKLDDAAARVVAIETRIEELGSKVARMELNEAQIEKQLYQLRLEAERAGQMVRSAEVAARDAMLEYKDAERQLEAATSRWRNAECLLKAANQLRADLCLQ